VRRLTEGNNHNGANGKQNGQKQLDQNGKASQPNRQRKTFQSWSWAELEETEFELKYLIEGCLVQDQPNILAGGKKSLKTTMLLDAAVALSTGTPFLNHLPVARRTRVGVLTGESGMATVKETLRRIAKSREIVPGSGVIIVTDEVPRVANPDHLEALEDFLQVNAIEAVFLDPAYLMLSGDGAENLMKQGDLLGRLSEVCRRNHATMTLCHHTKKTAKPIDDLYSPPELEDIAWSGFQEFARQWWLIGRRERYEPGSGNHKLWLNLGGSAGHSALWAVDIDEGEYRPGAARTYAVGVIKAEDARRDAKQRHDAAKQAEKHGTIATNMLKISNYLKGKPDGDTAKATRMACQLNPASFEAAVGKLLEQGAVEHCRVMKAGGSKAGFEGYRLTTKNNQTNDISPE
jgi:hypothetical protein